MTFFLDFVDHDGGFETDACDEAVDVFVEVDIADHHDAELVETVEQGFVVSEVLHIVWVSRADWPLIGLGL